MVDIKEIDESMVDSKEIDESMVDIKEIVESMVDSKEIDESMVDSKIIDESMVYSKAIDESMVDSKEIDKSIVDIKEIDESMDDSKIIDESMVYSKIIDESMVYSKAIDESMVDIKEIVESSDLHRQDSSNEKTVSANSEVRSAWEIEDTGGCSSGYDKKQNTHGTSHHQKPWTVDTKMDRNHCCCRCHYQSKSSPTRPLPSKSTNQSGGYTHQTATRTGSNQTREARTKTREESHSVTYGAVKYSDSHGQYTGSRPRLKNDSFQLDPGATIKSSEAGSLYISCGNRVAKKRTMLRILCQGIVLVLLCLCGGVFMYKNKHAGSHSKVLHKLPSSGINSGDFDSSQLTNIALDLPFKGVDLEDLEKHIEQSHSVTDVLKIFFDQPHLSDDEISSIMWMKSHKTLYGSEVSKQRRNHNIMNDVEQDEDEYGEEALKHSLEVATSPFAKCGDPVPELVRVEEPQKTSFKHFFPHCTILHRCRNTTGCCPNGYTCAPKKENGIRIVEKYFLVFKKSAESTVVPHAKQFVESRVFINHTACECKKIEIETNCHKKCPYQFVRERPGENCICICKPHNRVCRHMYRGLIPLDEKDLECIKRDKCIQPECHTGQFKVPTGFCPRFRHKHRGKE